jgi:hypothetical protein
LLQEIILIRARSSFSGIRVFLDHLTTETRFGSVDREGAPTAEIIAAAAASM